ncbi:MAG: single-stranded DNA-binding protein [Opitutales bacterium]
MAATSQLAVQAALAARETLRDLTFPAPADYVYNPLDYAWEAHRSYLERYAAAGPRAVLFLGMNPGPFGMAQTGVPFGEVAAVRDWLGIELPVDKPTREHPSKRVTGFACPRSEVSGRRLWGLFRERFGRPDAFFAGHTVHNYCPLLFLEDTKTGRNVTPEELPADAMRPVELACDRLLRDLVRILEVRTVVGVGGYAENKARQALEGLSVRFARVLHPSPASPAANRGWSEAATRELVGQGVWTA